MSLTRHFSIITLFPEVIEAYCSSSIVGRGRQAGLFTLETRNPRDTTTDPHRKVDDSPYGGGSGMVMSCQPIEAAFESLQPLKASYKVLVTSPAGQVFNQAMAAQLSAEYEQLVLVCGHYEGIDARLLELLPHAEEVSVGDYVLTGGELPALTIVDAMVRLIPGVVQKASSVQEDSFFNGRLLDTPHYTRPPVYKGLAVPDVLLSGNHALIQAWRDQTAFLKTYHTRPDLLAGRQLTEQEQTWLQQYLGIANP